MRANDETGAEGRERSIVESLRRIIRAVDLHSRRLTDGHGLTAPQLAAMQELHRSGSLSPGDLARRIHLSPATVTGILSRLEARGMITRAPSSLDRRRVAAGLTKLGTETLEEAPSLLQDRFRRALAGLQEWEQHQLLASLQRIASMMNADELDASPHLVTGDMAAPDAENTPATAPNPTDAT